MYVEKKTNIKKVASDDNFMHGSLSLHTYLQGKFELDMVLRLDVYKDRYYTESREEFWQDSVRNGRFD